MSGPSRPNPPWTQHETLELFTEILKTFEVQPERLLPLILELGEPAWEHVALPRGRTLAQCRDMYQDYVAHHSSRMMPARPVSLYGPPASAEFPTMQHAYAPEIQSPAQPGNARYPEIQPRPPNFAPGGSMAISPTTEPPRKKRGRPTKAEMELRREAARSRGELSPTRRRDILPAGPLPGTVSVAAQAAQAVMAPSMYGTRPTTPHDGAAVNRKRPLAPEGSEMARATPMPERAPQSSQPQHQRSQSQSQPRGPSQQTASQFPAINRPSQRDYPQILSSDPSGSQPTFKAPRGSE